MLAHGNGLAIDLYYPFWSLLAADFDLVVYDLRNHGWNDVGALDNHNFDAFARDHDRISEAIALLYGEKPAVGVFHSISALAALHLPSRGSGYSALVLFTPPMCNTGPRYGDFELLCKRTADMLRVRTPWFQTREELADLHTYLHYFQLAVPGVYELVARTTLRESRTGLGYELRCPREYEAQIWDDAPEPAVSVDFGFPAMSHQDHRVRPRPGPGPPDVRLQRRNRRRCRARVHARGFALPTAREAGRMREDHAEIPGAARHHRV